MKKGKFLIFFIFFSISCADDPQPKPNAFLAMEYPEPNYEPFNPDCPFHFEVNEWAVPSKPTAGQDCWLNLNYDLLNGTIFLTYQPVQNNLDSLLRDAQKLPLQHTIKADAIEGDVYLNPFNNTYGMFYEVSGNAASQAQFYLTDSVRHFLTGSIYFQAQPNFDSILPAAAYLKKDMRRLMETLEWQEE